MTMTMRLRAPQKPIGRAVAIVLVGAVVLSALAAGPTPAQAQCDGQDCAVCHKEGSQGVNFVSTLPRPTRSGGSASPDLGSYTLTTTDESGDVTFIGSDDVDVAAGPSGPDDVGNYADSIGVYVAFAFLMMILAPTCGACMCLCKYGCLCPCCCKKSGGCCGGRFPTKAEKCGCCQTCGPSCGCGFTRRPDGTFHYPEWSRWISRVWMWVVFACVVVLVLQGHANGNQGMTEGMKEVTTAPQGIADIVVGLVDPIGDFLINIASDSVVNLLIDLRDLLTSETDFGVIVDKVNCIIGVLDGLPDTGVLIQFVDDVEFSFNGIRNVTDTIPGFLDDINTTKVNIRREIASVVATMNQTTDAITVVRAEVLITQATVVDIDDLLNDLTNPTTGMPSMSQDLLDIANVPDQGAQDSVISGATASVSVLNVGGIDDDAVEMQEFADKMQVFADAYSNLPNYTLTAVNMAAFNDRMDRATNDNLIGNIVTSINNTRDALGGLPDSAAINVTINNLLREAGSLNLGFMRQALVDVNTSLALLPPFSILTDEIRKVQNIRPVIPCLLALTAELAGLNRTVFELPSAINQVTDMAADLNSTIEDAIASSQDSSDQIDDFDAERDNLNLDSFIVDLGNMEEEAANSLDNIDVDTLLGDLVQMEADADIDFSIVADLTNLQETMDNNRIDQDIIDNLKTFETAKSLATDVVVARTADAHLMARGFCSDDDSVACDTDGECVGTCTNQGTRRCEQQPGNVGNAIPCTEAADCPVGVDNRCLGDSSEWTTVAALMDGVDAPDVSAASDNIAAVDGAVTIDVGSFTTQLDDVVASMDGVDTATMVADVEAVSDSLDEFDVDDVRGSFEDMADQMDAVDFTPVRETLEAADDQLNNLDEQRSQLFDVRDMMEGFERIFVRNLESDYLDRLSNAELTARRDEDGMSGVFLRITEVLDDFTFDLNETTTLFPDIATNLTAEQADNAARLDLISHPRYQEHGPVYYLLTASATDGGSPRESAAGWMMDAEDPLNDRLYLDVNGEEYPEGAGCYTQECLNAEVTFYNTASVEEVSDGAAPVPLSREDLVLLLYVPAILVLLMGLLASLCFCTKCWRCSSICASCQVGCICIWVPLIFLFVGVVFWPMIMVFADVCYSMESVGLNYLTAGGDDTCTQQTGGEGTLDACETNFVTPVGNLTFELDIIEVYTGVMFGCPGDEDPLDPVFDSIQDALQTMPGDFISDFLNTTELPMPIRQGLKNIMIGFGYNVGGHMATMVGGFQEQAIGCDSLHSAYTGFKDAFCCDVLNPLYWLAASWYGIAICCCFGGTTAGMFGRKRWPGKLWGKSWKECTNVDGGGAPPGGAGGAAAAAGGDKVASPDGVGIEMVPPEDPGSLAPAIAVHVMGQQVTPRSYYKNASGAGGAAVSSAADSEQAAVTVGAALAAAAKDNADDPAVRFATPSSGGGAADSTDFSETWSWKNYAAQVNNVSRALITAEVDMYDRVLIVGDASPEWSLVHLATANIGAIAVGVPSESAYDAMLMLAARVDPTLIVVSDLQQLAKFASHTESLRRLRGFVCYGKDAQDVGIPADLAGELGRATPYNWASFVALAKPTKEKTLKKRAAAVQPTHCAAICFTSAATGPPKAVMLSHDNLVCTGYAVARGCRMISTDRVMAFMAPESAVALVSQVYAPLASRCAVFYAREACARTEGYNADALVSSTKDVRPTVMFAQSGVLTELHHYVQKMGALEGVPPTAIRGNIGLEDLRLTMLVGGRSSAALHQTFADLGIDLYESYGQTECTGFAAMTRPADAAAGGMAAGDGEGKDDKGEARRPGVVGRPLEGVGVRVRGPSADGADDGMSSQLMVQGRNVMMGYVNYPEGVSFAVDGEGWLHTGDLGAVEDGGDAPKDGGVVTLYGGVADVFSTSDNLFVDPATVETIVMARLPVASTVVAVGDAGHKHIGVLVALKATPDYDQTKPMTAPLHSDVLAISQSHGSTSRTLEEAFVDPFFQDYLQQRLSESNEQVAANCNGAVIGHFTMFPEVVDTVRGQLGAGHRVKRTAVRTNYAMPIDVMFKMVTVPGVEADPGLAAGAGAPAAASALPAAAVPAPVAAGAGAGVGAPAPSPTPAGPAQYVRREGTMRKLGQKVKSWQTRFFILDNNRLSYYTKKGGKMKGELVLNKDSSIAVSDLVEFGFALRATGNRVLVCECTDAADRDAWMKALWANIVAMQS